MSRTAIEVAADPRGGRAQLRLSGDDPGGRGHLGARVLAHGPTSARVALVAEGALLLAGDDITVSITVGAGMRLQVVEPAGTVAYDMRGGSARWQVAVRLDRGAHLAWRGEPFVVAAGAEVIRDVHLDLAEGSVAILRESLVLGRAGESGGVLTQRIRVLLDGRPLLAEDLELGPARPRTGVLGPARVIDTVSVLGRRAPGIPLTSEVSHRLELDGPGTVIRSLSTQAHLGCLTSVWESLVLADAALVI